MSLSKEDEKYCEAMFETFRTEGWKIFVEELKTNATQINSVEATKDNDDMRFRKGQLNIIASVVSLRDQVENLYDEKNL
jgi:hypothetical protein